MFSKFCKFLFVSCKVMKAVKINDTSYLSWGSSPKIASGSLRLVGVETRPTTVDPPLLFVAAAVSSSCCGVFRLYDAAMLGMSRCVGAAYLECCHYAPVACLAVG